MLLQAVREENFAKAEVALSKTLERAVTEALSCPGYEKLQAAKMALRLKNRFLLHADLQPFSDDIKDAAAYLGIKAFLGKLPDPPYHNLISEQWLAHMQLMKNHASKLSADTRPAEVYTYWKAMEESAPQLSALAQWHLALPVSSAAAERVFSLMTGMNTSTRRSMKEETLTNVLMLRGN